MLSLPWCFLWLLHILFLWWTWWCCHFSSPGLWSLMVSVAATWVCYQDPAHRDAALCWYLHQASLGWLSSALDLAVLKHQPHKVWRTQTSQTTPAFNPSPEFQVSRCCMLLWNFKSTVLLHKYLNISELQWFHMSLEMTWEKLSQPRKCSFPALWTICTHWHRESWVLSQYCTQTLCRHTSVMGQILSCKPFLMGISALGEGVDTSQLGPQQL